MAPTDLNDPSTSDVKDQIACLQRQVFSLLLALIVVSGTVTVYLYRQASLLHKDLTVMRPQAEQIINTFNQNRTVMQNFINQLNAYGQTHPEIQQILVRNGFASAPAPRK